MKRFLTILSLSAALAAAAAPVDTVQQAPSAYSIIARGQSYNVWDRSVPVIGANGQTVQIHHRYTELATGLNYVDPNGQWAESQERVVPLLTGGAAATQGQHTASFPYDLYTGAIEQVTPEGLHLRSRPLLIAYASGTNSQLIAELTNSTGQIVAAGNAVIYTNCTTDFNCDYIARYRKSGLECDLTFREKPPLPDIFGFDPDQTEVQLWTEFFDPPEPVQQPGPASSDGLQDTTLQFGATVMGRGSAFSIGSSQQPVPPWKAARVYKTWVHTEGRTFLVERVKYSQIKNDLDGLASVEKPARWFAEIGTSPSAPLPIIHKSNNPPIHGPAHPAFQRSTAPIFQFASLCLPPPRPIRPSPKPIQLASVDLPPRPGLLWDYTIVGSAATNYTFAGDTTYFISGYLNLYGTTTIEGGAILKLTNNLDPWSWCQVTLNGPLSCKTAPYRPAVFTSWCDDSCGETIGGSTGVPPTSLSSIGYTIGLDATVAAPTGQWILHDTRMSYLLGGFLSEADSDVLIADCQFVHCPNPCLAIIGGLAIQNVLGADCDRFAYANTWISAENITLVGYTNFSWCPVSLTCLGVTNSIVVGAGDWGNSDDHHPASAILDHTLRQTNADGLFTTAAGGFYYLCDASTNRNSGITNISPALLADIRQKTTYPPIVIAGGPLSQADITLSPQAQRDTDDIDLGFHYAPLDYAIGATCVTNPVTIAVSPGTAIACFGTNGLGHGLAIANGAQLLCQGTVTAPIHVAEYTAVQEQAGAGLRLIGYSLITDDVAETGSPPAVPANADCRFTEFSLMTDYAASLGFFATPCAARDCQFHGGEFASLASFALTNNLFERVLTYMSPGSNATCCVRNNLFYNREFDIYLDVPASVTIKDNLFDRTDITEDFTAGTLDAACNAYITNANRLTPTNTNDLIITNTDYIAGPLGNYYYPTNGGNLSRLINAGSTNADMVGLYHYSLITNMTGGIEIKETNSIVDIGFHWVAVDTNGIPGDADGDGVADYIEDANGDGQVDSGETDWQSSEDLGLKVVITRPRNGSTIP